MADRQPERYEPLPGLTELPAFVWRRLPGPAKVAVAMLPVAAVVLALLLAPGIQSGKEERERSEQTRAERARAERIAALKAEQRPRFGRSDAALPAAAPPARRLASREAVLADMERALGRDARARVARGELTGSIDHVRCEGFPRTAEGARPERNLRRAQAAYACLAVTASVDRSESTTGLRIGHPYRALIAFETGRYAFCKVSGRPGEGGLVAKPVVTVPAVCGGR